ncbi:hypothetical protein F2P56_000932 [Juglans regia]|uniref:Uncharacterized protein n=1 Tax=Juglans regia TaxID=51240 RepID=A0A833Y9J6_JUGRE|nr:hypothetical protein F2P56_000932 [Juglans regia]
MVGGTAKCGQFPALTLVMLLLIMFLHNTSHCGEATAHASTRDNGTYLNYHGPMAIDEPELLMFDSQISRMLIDYPSKVEGSKNPNKQVYADCKNSCLGKKYDIPGREKCDGNSFKRKCP